MRVSGPLPSPHPLPRPLIAAQAECQSPASRSSCFLKRLSVAFPPLPWDWCTLPTAASQPPAVVEESKMHSTYGVVHHHRHHGHCNEMRLKVRRSVRQSVRRLSVRESTRPHLYSKSVQSPPTTALILIRIGSMLTKTNLGSSMSPRPSWTGGRRKTFSAF